jgi:hypothetical protein
VLIVDLVSGVIAAHRDGRRLHLREQRPKQPPATDPRRAFTQLDDLGIVGLPAGGRRCVASTMCAST